MSSRVAALRAEMDRLAGKLGRPARFMEVCGTHTVSIFRSGLRSLFPRNLRLVSGPGCPVCVTAQRHIDAAIELGAQPGAILATYGDMMRVPGRRGSLERLRAGGADVRVVTSALGSLELARKHPSRPVVFLGVGFETTAPATAATVVEAAREGVGNWYVLAAHKLVVPAMMALLEGGDVPLDGFLCPGHVSVIIGSDAYRPVVERHRKACVVAGFETEQILLGMNALLRQAAEGRADLENVYTAVVRPEGNAVAQRMMAEVFVPSETAWRALGVIPESGLDLAPAYRRFDALERFGVTVGEDEDHPACRCGEVIQGKAEPPECGLFGTACTPLNPIGPCMVSSEGTCAAWYRYAGPARTQEARA